MADSPSESESLGFDAEAIEFERQQEAEDAKQRELMRRQATVRAEAHANMPSTMYASTPSDPDQAPHVVAGPATQSDDILDLVMPRYLESVAEADAKPFSKRLSEALQTLKRIEQFRETRDISNDWLRSPHKPNSGLTTSQQDQTGYAYQTVIPYFPSASDASNRQGIVRLVNRSSREGQVTIKAIDNAGTEVTPITLSIHAGSSIHLSSTDLERGSESKGIDVGIGSGQGAWVLVISSTVPIEALGYVQSADGYLTTINVTVPKNDDNRVVTYITSRSDTNSQASLRVVNLNSSPAELLITELDESGTRRVSETFELPARQARTYFIHELASGNAPDNSGFTNQVDGIWHRFAIESEPDVLVLSMAESDAGHLTNHSSLAAETGRRNVPLFMSASDPHGRQGLLHMINRENRLGTVHIQPIDDSGRYHERLTFSVEAKDVVEIDSDDLELGNREKGLFSGTGRGEGNWRLLSSSELDLEVLAFVKTSDGWLTSMHDVVPKTENRYEMLWFKAVDDSKQSGQLRLINTDARPANITIQGTDDKGLHQGTVRVTLAPNASRTLSSMELETGGERLTGKLGDGYGDWRLVVTADVAIEVMNLMSSPSGHLSNLSIAASMATNEEETVEGVFESDISPIVQSQCINCHVPGRAAQNTRLVFVDDANPDHLAKNLAVFRALLDEVDDGAQYILNKIQGVGHGGGAQVRAGTDNFKAMERFLELLGLDVEGPPPVTVDTLFNGVTLETFRQTLRRAAIVFAGRVPNDEEYATVVEGDESTLRTAIRRLMAGPGFHDFLVRASNDRLFTDRDYRILDDDGDGFVEFPTRLYQEKQRGQDAYRKFLAEAQYGFRRAPLELIAYVVESELPYTEILTADYIMANPMAAAAYGATTEFENLDDPHEFRPSTIESYYRPCEGYQLERDDFGYVVINTGPCDTEYPHAGLLNTKVFLQRYPTTATNRNRARSRWTYYHFLGLDIENSASRTTDPVALADTNNPTMGNHACTVCHSVLDPVAGIFQNYGDDGLYRDQGGGMDALDRFYKYHPSGRIDVAVEQRTREESFVSLGTVRLLSDRVNELGLKNLRTFEGDTKLHLGLGEVTLTDMDSNVVHQFEVSDVAQEEDCGDALSQGYKLWDCSAMLVLPLETEVSGDYEVHMEAWVLEEGTAAATLQVWMPGPFYRSGDTWYRDMREPGFGEDTPAEAHNSVQWLAERIVDDERFAEATVKFWWPAIMGSEVAEPPEDPDDSDYEAALLTSNAQSQEVERLASAFSLGFHGGDPFNLKDLLVEISLSAWFRAAFVETDDILRNSALATAGAKRLLTPEELARKTLHLTGFQWGRNRDQTQHRPERETLSALTDSEYGYGLLYGGIDSDGITERARDLTSTMAGVAQSHAVESSCPIVMRELFLLPKNDRLLFEGIDQEVTPTREFSETFTITAASRSEIETLTLNGILKVGDVTITMAYLNDYRGGPEDDRDVLLDRLRVLQDDKVIFELEMEEHEHEPKCHHYEQAAFHLSGSGAECVLSIPVSISTDDVYTVELTAWGDQAGDESPRLAVSVESDASSSAGAIAIREKLAQLYSGLLGIEEGSESDEVRGAYELFVDVWQQNFLSEQARTDFRHWEAIDCDWHKDPYFFDGLLEDAWVFREDWGGEHSARSDWDWEHIRSYFDSVDFSDRDAIARTWVVVLAYLLIDHRYLYL